MTRSRRSLALISGAALLAGVPAATAATPYNAGDNSPSYGGNDLPTDTTAPRLSLSVPDTTRLRPIARRHGLSVRVAASEPVIVVAAGVLTVTVHHRARTFRLPMRGAVLTSGRGSLTFSLKASESARIARLAASRRRPLRATLALAAKAVDAGHNQAATVLVAHIAR